MPIEVEPMAHILNNFLDDSELGGMGRNTYSEFSTEDEWVVTPADRATTVSLLPSNLLAALAASGIQPPPKPAQVLCDTMKQSNMKFSIGSKSSRDSQISYRVNGGGLRLGRIFQILCEPNDAQGLNHPSCEGRIIVVIEQYRPLSEEDRKKDLFWNHPIIGQEGYRLFQLAYDQFVSKLDVVHASDIVGHISRCTLDQGKPDVFERAVIVTVQMDRVSDISTFQPQSNPFQRYISRTVDSSFVERMKKAVVLPKKKPDITLLIEPALGKLKIQPCRRY